MLSEKDLTVILHRTFCIHNSGSCEWYRETDSDGDIWKQPTHKKCLAKVQNFIRENDSNVEQIVEAMNIVNEVKKLF